MENWMERVCLVASTCTYTCNKFTVTLQWRTRSGVGPDFEKTFPFQSLQKNWFANNWLIFVIHNADACIMVQVWERCWDFGWKPCCRQLFNFLSTLISRPLPYLLRHTQMHILCSSRKVAKVVVLRVGYTAQMSEQQASKCWERSWRHLSDQPSLSSAHSLSDSLQPPYPEYLQHQMWAGANKIWNLLLEEN